MNWEKKYLHISPYTHKFTLCFMYIEDPSVQSFHCSSLQIQELVVEYSLEKLRCLCAFVSSFTSASSGSDIFVCYLFVTVKSEMQSQSSTQFFLPVCFSLVTHIRWKPGTVHWLWGANCNSDCKKIGFIPSCEMVVYIVHTYCMWCHFCPTG